MRFVPTVHMCACHPPARRLKQQKDWDGVPAHIKVPMHCGRPACMHGCPVHAPHTGWVTLLTPPPLLLLQPNHRGKFDAAFRKEHKTAPEYIPWVAGSIARAKGGGRRALAS